MQRKNRRQTLGSVSGNGGNRRKSVGQSNSGGPGSAKARPPRGRASMIPRVGRENLVPPTPPTPSNKTATSGSRSRRSSGVSGDRRQSMVPPPAPAKTDPRPIADKNFQQECIKKLLDFLMTQGYEQPISHRSLSRPSGKDFSNIVTFMLRLVDPSFQQDGSMKIEDEIAMSFKAMGYPFPVSKTALVAAGSPHTWPSLLAALTWLMDTIQCQKFCALDADDDPGHFDSLEELEDKTDKAFFNYLSEAYTAFLRGDEQLTEQLENALADRFERDDVVIEQEIEQLTDKNAVILEQINNLTFREKDLIDYEQKKKGYATDLEQFHDLIQQMEQHVDTLSQKKKDRALELEDTNRKLARAAGRVEDLKKCIGSQSLSLDDVQKMQNELKGVEEAIGRAHALQAEHSKSLWEGRTEINALLSELESMAATYNAKRAELNLLPFVLAEESEAGVAVDRKNLAESDQTRLLGVNMQEKVQTWMLGCKQKYCEEVAELKLRYQESLDQAERSEEAFTEALERLKIIEGKTDKHEESLEAERQSQEAKLDVRSREADSMDAKVASLRNPVAIEEQIAQYERQCAELEALLLKNEQENVTRKKAVFDEIAEACAAIKEYDEFCKSKIEEVNNYREGRESSYGRILRPKIL